MLSYTLKFQRDDNGTLLVTCPALPEVTTFGRNGADAARHARRGIKEALPARMAAGMDIPTPGLRTRGHSVALPLLGALKVLLYRTLRESGVTRAEFRRRLQYKRELIERLLSLNHRSRVDHMEAAFRALGRSVTVSVQQAGHNSA
jgi:antitoxin HicB